MPHSPFLVACGDVEDLFYAPGIDANDEYDKLNLIINSPTGEKILTDLFEKQPYRRQEFVKLALKMLQIDIKTATEIFSCATECFAEETSSKSAALPDCEMNENEFSNALIRLSNLSALMKDGVDGAGNLSGGFITFLNDLKEAYSLHK